MYDVTPPSNLQIVFLFTVKTLLFCYHNYNNNYCIYQNLSDNWSEKAIRRHTTGTGRLRYLKIVHRRFQNGFKEGTQPISKKKRKERKIARRQRKQAKPVTTTPQTT